MKSFPVECDFAGVKVPVDVWAGEPAPDADPLWAQQYWLLDVRGGVIPDGTLDAFKSIQQRAQLQQRPFEDMCETELGGGR
jgi:hypothetical protein